MKDLTNYDAVAEILGVVTDFVDADNVELIDDFINNLDEIVNMVFNDGFSMGLEVGKILNKDA